MGLTIILEGYCFAINSHNPFNGTWINDYGRVTINDCKHKKCFTKIYTDNGRFTCEIDGFLYVQSPRDAILYLESLEFDESGKHKNVPIKFFLSNQKIVITIPEESHSIARDYCGAAGSFDGKYINSKAPYIYEPSFDCDGVKTKIEVTICRTADLARLDNALAVLYYELKANGVKKLTNQQKQWIKDRNSCSNSKNMNKCLFEKYDERVTEFQERLTKLKKQS